VKPNEIIVVDDGSKDGSLAIAQKYPIRIVKHKENMGLAETRNTGIKNARFNIIIFIDVDCVADRNLIENIVKNYTYKKIAGVGGFGLEINSKGLANKYRSIHGVQGHGSRKKFVNALFGLCFSFRKNVLKEVGLFDTKFKTNGEDVDIGFRITQRGYMLIYDPKVKVFHFRDDRTISSYQKTVYNYFYYGSIAHLKNKNRANKWFIKSFARIFFKNFKNMFDDIKSLRFDIFLLTPLLTTTELISCISVYKFYIKSYKKCKI
jgi:GT2 family glycosyltransferase